MVPRLNKREQVILIITLCLSGFFVGYLFVLKPMQEQRSSLENQILAQKSKLKRHVRSAKASSGTTEVYQSIRDQYKQSGADEQVMASMVKDIERQAGQFSLKISDLKPQRVRKGDFYNSFSVSLKIDSSLSDIVQFIQKLQSSELMFDVQEVRFNKSARRNSKTIKTDLVLRKVFIP